MMQMWTIYGKSNEYFRIQIKVIYIKTNSKWTKKYFVVVVVPK